MLVLMGIRMLYYLTLEYAVYVSEKDGINEIFNIWRIVPYITEIILNCVIFYYNFIKEKFGSG